MATPAHFASLNAISLDLWFRADNMNQLAVGTSGTRGVLFSSGATARGISLSMENNALRFLLKDTGVGSSDATINLSASLAGYTTSDFIRATVTIDNVTDNVFLYVNGALAASSTSTAFGNFLGDNNTAIGGVRNQSGVNRLGGGDQANAGNTTDFIDDYGYFVGDIAYVAIHNDVMNVIAVPEPATATLVMLSALGLWALRRRLTLA